ncbi:hypothetical protein PG985_004158 [Apiospora marii]|uniref:Uncharacterized protein n=1 Tax=Apiospora marii TaxID=335849 RepID=A0ABR1S9S8_9PEZI
MTLASKLTIHHAQICLRKMATTIQTSDRPETATTDMSKGRYTDGQKLEGPDDGHDDVAIAPQRPRLGCRWGFLGPELIWKFELADVISVVVCGFRRNMQARAPYGRQGKDPTCMKQRTIGRGGDAAASGSKPFNLAKRTPISFEAVFDPVRHWTGLDE